MNNTSKCVQKYSLKQNHYYFDTFLKKKITYYYYFNMCYFEILNNNKILKIIKVLFLNKI